MLTVEELAKFLKVTDKTIYRMIDEKKMPFAFKVNGNWRFEEQDVKAWIEKQKEGNK